MKKLCFLLATLTCVIGIQAQTVGIGTPTPNANAILDIVSPNKGVLFPRLADTANVSNPLEGLMIYNKNNKAPYFYNGKQWLSLGARGPVTLSPNNDAITYKIEGDGFSTTEEPVLSLSQGVSNPATIDVGGIGTGKPSQSTINLMTSFGINSKSFNLAVFVGTKLASIEIKFYAANAAVPYLSYRMKNIVIESYQISASGSANEPPTESVSIAFENYGVKDWVNNMEFGFSLVTYKETVY